MSENRNESPRRTLWSALSRARTAPVAPPPEPPAFHALFGQPEPPAPPTPQAPPVSEPPVVDPVAAAMPIHASRDAFAAPRDPSEFLSPTDLEIDAGEQMRILAIGSCTLQGLMTPGDGSQPSFQADFILLNAPQSFPASPPDDIAEYDCQIIQVPLRGIVHDEVFAYLDPATEAPYRAVFEEAARALKRHLDACMAWNVAHGTTTFVMNFMQPQFTLMGRFHPRFDLRNYEYFVMRLNQKLERYVAGYRNAYIIDADRIAASFGRRFVQDDSLTGTNHNSRLPGGMIVNDRIEPLGPVMEYFDVQEDGEFREAFIAELRAMHRTLQQADSVKLVVLDLDDTLWNGVSGEAADIGPHMCEGWPVGLREALHILRKRGILLAIISKNEESRIREIWDSILRYRLKLDDFAGIRINWRPKPDNMRELLGAMKLRPQNVLFIDDNPSERAQMQAAFPAIRTLGRNPYHLRRILLQAPEMQVAAITQEAASRNAMMQAQLVRESERAALAPEEFLKQQAIRVTLSVIGGATDRRYARVVELLNRTNQFNTTGRRWQPAELGAFFASGGTIHAYEVEDRYTAYGLVGLVLIGSSTIVQWVMSCRVIGLGAERAAMHILVTRMRGSHSGLIEALAEDTHSNQPSRTLYSEAGFTRQGSAWHLLPGVTPPMPDHVTLVPE